VKTNPPKWGIFSVYFIFIFIYGFWFVRSFCGYICVPNQVILVCVCVCCGLESFMFLTDGGKILYIHLDTQMVWLRRFAFSNAKQNQRRNNRRIPLNDTPANETANLILNWRYALMI